MIIILTPEKDTYVTNLKTKDNNGLNANVGHAATLDLFKLYNENKNSNSWAAFRFTGALDDGKTFIITDSAGITKTFEFDDNNSITAGNIRLNIAGKSHSSYASIIAAAVNAEDTLGITGYSNSNNDLILKQDKSGESGDTIFTLPADTNNMVHIGGLTKFARIDYSAVLLKFDISEFKSKYVDGGTFANSVYNNNLTFKAELVLKDVTTGISKPTNYELSSYPLLKDFKEGVGKDTIHFSDGDKANFVDISESQSWEVPGVISKSSDFVANTSYHSNTNNTDQKKGNEDITFDVTNYIKEFFSGDTSTNNGFVITFSESYLYNQITYFAKRVGSRHLLNKKFIPQLRIIIKDSDYHIPQNPKNKKRYLNNEEIFYLFNRVNGKLKEFSLPTSNDIIKFKIGSLFDSTTDSGSITNFKGKDLIGIKKKTLSNTDISRFNSNISTTLLSKGFYKDKITWYWEDSDTTIVEAGSFVVGKKYKIRNYAAGENDFTLIGASNNNVGTVFTATGAGSGAGDAFEIIEYTILTEDVTFYAGETLKEINYRNVNTAIRIEDNNFIAKDNVQTVEVFFIDTFAQYDYVKVPYDLPSDNLGDVYYKVIDIDTNDILVDYEESIGGTKMFFDGEKYIFDFFVPEIFKNKRIVFEFKMKDNITGADKYIKNESKVFKVK
jgi:hypothetical protein